MMNEASEVVNLPALAPQVSKDELYEILAKALHNAAQVESPAKPILSGIDKILGGSSLVGLKTLIGLLGTLGTIGLHASGTLDSGQIYDVLVLAFSAFGGAGLLAKLDRFVLAATQVAQFVSKEGPKLAEAIEKGAK